MYSKLEGDVYAECQRNAANGDQQEATEEVGTAMKYSKKKYSKKKKEEEAEGPVFKYLDHIINCMIKKRAHWGLMSIISGLTVIITRDSDCIARSVKAYISVPARSLLGLARQIQLTSVSLKSK